MKTLKIFIIVAVLALFTTNNYAQEAKTILKKVDDVTSVANDVTQHLEIILIDKNNRKQTRKAIVYQKGTNKRLFRFTAPSAQKGIGFLSLPNDVMYLYMPAYGKERRIASSVKNQKFAGTDMSYDDLEAKKYSDKYNPELISTQGNYYILKLTPIGRSQYSKLILKVKKTDYLPVLVEYYNRGNKKVKKTELDFVKSGKYYYPKTMTVTDLRTNHKTIMKAYNVKFDQGLKDEIFTVRNLKKI